MHSFHRTLFVLLFSACVAFNTTGQPLPVTDVVLIGTKHNPNPVYNSDSLLKVVIYLKPDLILIEHDSTSYTFKRGMYRTLPDWSLYLRRVFRRGRLPVEDSMLHRFHPEFPRVIIKPCDVAFNGAARERYRKNYLKLEDEFTDAMFNAYEGKQMPAHLEHAHAERRKLIPRLRELIDHGTLQAFNSDSATQMIRTIETMDKVHYKALADSVPSLQRYAARVDRQLHQAAHRDEVMVQQIIRYINEFRGKRIVVITGVLHRYYQLDRLAPLREQHQFRLLDINGKEMNIPAEALYIVKPVP